MRRAKKARSVIEETTAQVRACMILWQIIVYSSKTTEHDPVLDARIVAQYEHCAAQVAVVHKSRKLCERVEAISFAHA